MSKNIIPIAFSTDNNYVIPLTVTIYSMLENADENTHYNIFVLTDNQLTNESKKTILLLDECYNNCSLEFIILDNIFDNLEFKFHFTKAICYRLMLGSLLPNHDKCIYLDCDIIVKKDLTQLFNTDLSAHYVAGLKDFPAIVCSGQQYADKIGIPEISQYINSGVLVLNLDKIREDELELKFLTLAQSKKFEYVDQDIINIVCYNNIKHLEFKYNLQPSYLNLGKNKKFIVTEEILECFSLDEINNALNDNFITHYSAVIKPWKDKYCIFGEVWWQYYESSPLNKLNLKILDKFLKKSQMSFGNIINEDFNIYKNKTVVLLGIDSTTKPIFDLMSLLEINIDFICDNNKNNWGNLFENVPIISPLKLKQLANNKKSGLIIQIATQNDTFKSIGGCYVFPFEEAFNVLQNRRIGKL